MERTVGSYEEEREKYLNSRRAFEAVHAGAMREAHDAYLDAIRQMQDAYRKDLAKMERLWKELCRAKGWTP
jgi:hypothetical protein